MSTDSVDIDLSKLKEIVEARETWHAVVHSVAKSQIGLRDLTTTKIFFSRLKEHGIKCGLAAPCRLSPCQPWVELTLPLGKLMMAPPHSGSQVAPHDLQP